MEAGAIKDPTAKFLWGPDPGFPRDRRLSLQESLVNKMLLHTDSCLHQRTCFALETKDDNIVFTARHCPKRGILYSITFSVVVSDLLDQKSYRNSDVAIRNRTTNINRIHRFQTLERFSTDNIRLRLPISGPL